MVPSADSSIQEILTKQLRNSAGNLAPVGKDSNRDGLFLVRLIARPSDDKCSGKSVELAHNRVGGIRSIVPLHNLFLRNAGAFVNCARPNGQLSIPILHYT